jgi:uncharacterized protein YndB with AHSA1/START domain
MTVVETTAPSQTASVSLEFDLPHAPAKVWRALTDPALLAEWLLPAVGFHLERGAAFTFNAPPQPNWDGVVQCRVLDVDERKKLSYRWVVGDIDTVVTFTLAQTPSGTRLSLVQSGFKPEQKHNFAGARYGLKMMGGKLVDLLARLA